MTDVELREKLIDFLDQHKGKKWKSIGETEFEVEKLANWLPNSSGSPMVEFKNDVGNRNAIPVEAFIRINGIELPSENS